MMKFYQTCILMFCAFWGQVSYAQGPSLPKTSGKVSVDFHDVDIKDVIKAMSEITGKNFIMDDKVRGRITVVSPKPVTIEEAYQAFLSALEMNNFTTAEVGKFTKIVSSRDRGKPIPFITGESKDFGDQLVTKIIQLKYINADEINRTVRRMVSSNGTSNSYANTNSLIVTDTASNIGRIEQVISELDKQSLQSTPEFIPLKHTQADAIAKMLLAMFKKKSGGEDGEGGGGSDVQDIMADERTNSLIVIATRNGLGKVLDALGELDKPIEAGAQKGRVHFVKLMHANADDIAGTLSNLFAGKSGSSKKNSGESESGSSNPAPGGTSGSSSSASRAKKTSSVASAQSGDIFDGSVSVVSDPNTNSLIVTASPKDFDQLKPIILELDKRRAQVYVEALIMEVNLSKDTQVGLSGHGAGAAGGINMFGGQNGGLLNAVSMSDVTKLGALAGAGGLVLGGMGKAFNLPGTNIQLPFSGATFKALQTNNVVNILSAPNILTVDNKKAEIMVGKQINFQKSSQAIDAKPVVNYERQRIGLSLSVTPQINEGDEVTMEVEQKTEDIENAKAEGGPTTSERLAKTTVISKSGQTVAIGGLIQERDEKSVTKVPLLGDVPILGYLFRDTTKSTRKVNLLIFLTPSVIRDPNDMTRISVKKNKERQEFNSKNGIRENQGLRDYGLDKGLNLAAPSSADAEKTKPKKKFNYEGTDTNNERSRRSEDEETRPRTQKDTRERTNKSSNDETPRRGKGVNPFADVRPPSSDG